MAKYAERTRQNPYRSVIMGHYTSNWFHFACPERSVTESKSIFDIRAVIALKMQKKAGISSFLLWEHLDLRISS